MSDYKKQNLKRLTYVVLSLSAIVLSTQSAALDISENEPSRCLGRLRPKHHSSFITKEDRDRKYMIRGIVLGAGSDKVSSAIRCVTGSKFSHAGILLSDVNNPTDDPKKWYCFESTGSQDEVLHHGRYPHVRTTLWDKVVEDYEGELSYRLLVFDEDKTVSVNTITRFVKEHDNRLYTRNPMHLLKALLGISTKPSSPRIKGAFCSELAADMLMTLDILPPGTPGNFLPKTLSTETRMTLRKGVELTDEIPAK